MVITARTILKTRFGDFQVAYHKTKYGSAVSFSKGDISIGTPVVRFNSACLFGEAFHSLHCDCEHQLTETMRLIKENDSGTIIYRYQEGRGIGLEKKIKAMEIERTQNMDTVEAFKKLGLKKSDYRNFKAEVQALKDLKSSKTIETFSGNPKKIKALEDAGYKITKILSGKPSDFSPRAKKERAAKEKKMGYHY